MTDQQIKDLMQHSRLETSEAFTERTMDLLQERIQRRMKLRLYLLIVFVVLFFALAVFTLIAAGFKVDVFGLIIILPKVLSMIAISLAGYFILLHLYLLLNSETFGKPSSV